MPKASTPLWDHLASHSKAYRERSKEYYIGRAASIMAEFAEVVRYMFLTATQPEEVYYRSCDGLLHLVKATDPVLFRRACQAALEHQRYNYPFINNLVKSKCRGLDELAAGGLDSLSPPTDH